MSSPAQSLHPIKIAVTGAAGTMASSLLRRTASGEVRGRQQPVELQLLAIEKAQAAARGVVCEWRASAVPCPTKVGVTTDTREAFNDVAAAVWVGARART